MGGINDKGADAFRDYVTAGLPASGANEPRKADIRALFSMVDGSLSQLAGAFVADNATLIYANRDSLYANLSAPDRSFGIVYNDTPARNGIYYKSGATGSGSWLPTGLMLQGNAGERGLIGLTGPAGKSFLQTAIDTGYVPAGTTEAQLNDKIVGAITAAATAQADRATARANDAAAQAATSTVSAARAKDAQTSSESAASVAGQYRQAIEQAVAGLPTNAVLPLQAVSRAALASFTGHASGRQAILSEAGRAGLWEMLTGNQAARVASDPDQAFYVATPAGSDGSAGCWRRVLLSGIVMASWAGVNGEAIDQAPRIKRLLAHTLTSTVILPDTTVYLGRAAMIPDLKALYGQGRGRTILKALPNFISDTNDAANPNNNAMIYGMPGSRNIRTGDYSLDGSKVGTHFLGGVHMIESRDFLCERVSSKDISCYARWAAAENGECSGRFVDQYSENANVHYETTKATGVLFENFKARDGDGDIPCEAIIHPYSSSHVTYRGGDCEGKAAAGAGALIANYHPASIEDIVVEETRMRVTTTSAAAAIIAFNGPIKGVHFRNSSFRSESGTGAYTSGDVSVTVEGGVIDGVQEGLTIGAGTRVNIRGGRYTARANGLANNYPLLIDSSKGTKVVLDGPILDGSAAVNQSYPSNSAITVISQPIIVDPNVGLTPIGVGHKVTLSLSADQLFGGAAPNPAVIGTGTNPWAFNGLSGGSYRVRAEGSYKAADTETGLNLVAQSYGPRRLTGRAQAERTAYDANPPSAALTTDGNDLHPGAPDAANASRGFRLEFIYVATDNSFGSGFNLSAGSRIDGGGLGGAGVTIEAGAVMTVEKLA